MGPPAWSGSFTSLAGHAADGVVLRRGLAHSPRRTQCCRRDHRRREYASRLIARDPRDPAAEASTTGRQSKLGTRAYGDVMQPTRVLQPGRYTPVRSERADARILLNTCKTPQSLDALVRTETGEAQLRRFESFSGS
jgi:hypothetical protein